MVLLSTQNLCLNSFIRKYSKFHAKNCMFPKYLDIHTSYYMHSEILTCPKSNCKLYKRTLKTHHHIFALFLQTVYAIVKLLPGFNVQPKIGMNQSLIWLHYHVTLLMTSHGYIQHPAPFCTVKWSFLIISMFKLCRVWYYITKRVYRLYLIKSNW